MPRNKDVDALREKYRHHRRIGGKDTRPLQIKIRISARKGMITSREDLLDLIETIIEEEYVPEGVTIHWIDWKKGSGGKANEGHITENLAKELQAFWLAISHEDASVRLKRLEAKSRARRKSKGRVSERPDED